jgi:polysaccharide biosynthesis transport protein
LPESTAFSLYYLNPDPEIARDITRRISDLFLTYNREVRVERARRTYDFLLAKSKEVDERIKQLDQKLAEFKSRFGDALPDSRVRNEGSLDRTQRDLDSMQAQIRAVEQQEAMLKLQLGQISPMMATPGTDAFTQLATLRAELAAAQQKYTPDHPDVKRLTRAVEALVAQAQLSPTVSVRPDNPDYIRVAEELAAVQRNLVALRSTANRAQMQLSDYERRLTLAPTVERDYVQIDRERDLAQDEFSDIQSKLREAETAQTLETAAIGERYTMIRAPRIADKPYSPNRLGLILLGCVLAFGTAIGLAAFKESSDPTVRSSADLPELANLPLMGAIPSLLNKADRRSRRRLLGAIAGVYSIATVLVAFVVIAATRGG